MLVAGAALLYLVLEVRAYYIDIPFWDEWLLLPLLWQQAHGGVSLSALLTPHNEHIPLVPRIALLALAQASGWNLWYECVANIVTGAAILAALVLVVRRRSRPAVERHALYATLAVVTFSLNQWENWIWGWQLAVFLNAAALAWALVLLTASPNAVRLLLASGCGLVATFSFGNGLLFWPATLPLVWARWRQRPAGLVYWCLVAAAATWVYLSRLDLSVLIGVERRALDAGQMLDVTLRTLGSALTGHLDGSRLVAVVGAAGLLLAVVTSARHLRRPDWRAETLAWTALLLYGIGTALLVALGRTIPPHEAIPPRYLTFINLFWIAVVVLSDRGRWRQVSMALIVAGAATATALQAREQYVQRKASLLSARSALYGPPDNPLLSRLFWDKQVVVDLLPMLRDLRVSVYDCRRQLSRGDWQAAADTLAVRGRPGDLVVTTTAWAAACLIEHLEGRNPGVTVVSADESQANTLDALKGRSVAFLTSGGDVRSGDARAWVERHGFPLYRSPVGSVRLFFHPDRAAFVSRRLTTGEIARDAATLASTPDLVTRADDHFLLHGWSHDASDTGGHFRALLDRVGSLYVPVVRQAPQRFRLHGRKAAALEALPGGNTLTVSVNDAPIAEVPIPHTEVSLDLDVAAAPWHHGGNVLRVELRHTPGVALNRDDFPLLIVRRLVLE